MGLHGAAQSCVSTVAIRLETAAAVSVLTSGHCMRSAGMTDRWGDGSVDRK